ncbi:glycoside hydrolase family 3 N-terminal domain-containing protein [Actinospica robiniae]|uniref:glycoside hydrolase family 3 N-terminal domain-containing protein n=1 Tax=Actinospica robiniae TaxID=304901 RepID=UPI0003FF1CAB|nr:glycoside hydrolase family 3 N-terminal domain-containing protein [Actinospica robiniae]
MVYPGSPLSRRDALAVAGASLAAVAALPGVARAADAQDSAPRFAPEPDAELTVRHLAAQRVIFSYPGATVPQSLLDLIAAGLVGGVILYGENISSLPQITAAVAQMREANASSPVRAPLLVMTDQEGGKVRRLPGGPVQTAKQIGASPDPGPAAAGAGREAGLLLRSAGLNVNLAPVLDVFRTPGDFEDQYQRSFSMDPAVVATCGTAFIAAQQETGVAATAKHFPGLGPASAKQNTDNGPVTLTTSLSDLRSIDEQPYIPAIAANLALVMMSWAVYTALDPNYPAGLSSKIIRRELRDRLGFEGVTISDAINAGALAAFGTPPQNAVKAANAGMDLILESTRDISHGQAVVDALTAALADGTLDVPESDAALRRIMKLRRELQ